VARGSALKENGMEPAAVNNLANIEALVNMIANASEILGIVAGAPSLAFCWIPFAMGT
jgi:hypothetical protein